MKLWSPSWPRLGLMAFFLGGLGSGCLMTRSEVSEKEQKKVIQDQVVSLQKTYADQQSQGQEILEQMRNLTGRLEALEAEALKDSQAQEERSRSEQNQAQEIQKRILALQEEILALKAGLDSLKEKVPSSGAANSSGASGVLGGPVEADEAFQSKEWRRAAVLYQKWREKNPKHRAYSEATYKLGVSLVEQGMKEEAAVFFEEVLRKFPGSSGAKKSQAALKKLK
ncbi:MAG: tetratricopeptide repeat protein [Bdellovibrio sp.]